MELTLLILALSDLILSIGKSKVYLAIAEKIKKSDE
ncbi:hypothetical protein NtB2_01643 [Lactococcus termiticola]|uniref:Uncharacterized protein n=1 Tax=Lactococcus termiticola TaxID=2169526 RepID=A0A2R5HHF7_9LACT|nr:hypothetical protein NtB2_01643 [Lactococcus termiticola]